MCKDRIETATERAGGAIPDATGTAYDHTIPTRATSAPPKWSGIAGGEAVDQQSMTSTENIAFNLQMQARESERHAFRARRVANILERHPEFHEFLEVLRSGLVVLLLVFFATAGHAQTKPTTESLQTTVAEQAVTIARLQAQVHELQFQVNLYDSAMGTSARRSQDQQAVQAAEQASIAAHKATPAPAVKPAVKAAIPKK